MCVFFFFKYYYFVFFLFSFFFLYLFLIHVARFRNCFTHICKRVSGQIAVLASTQPRVENSIGNVTRHLVVGKEERIQFKGSRDGAWDITSQLVVPQVNDLKIVGWWERSIFWWTKPSLWNITSQLIVAEIKSAERRANGVRDVDFLVVNVFGERSSQLVAAEININHGGDGTETEWNRAGQRVTRKVNRFEICQITNVIGDGTTQAILCKAKVCSNIVVGVHTRDTVPSAIVGVSAPAVIFFPVSSTG